MGWVFRGMGFYRFCECVCFFLNLLFFAIGFEQVYTFYFMLCNMCNVLHITKSKSLCSRENEFEIESFGDFPVYKFQFVDRKIWLVLLWLTVNSYHYFFFFLINTYHYFGFICIYKLYDIYFYLKDLPKRYIGWLILWLQRD